jgi:two-component system NarL family response regulator
MDQSCIRVLCVDDHPVVREGLCAMIDAQPDMKVVATAATGREAVGLFREQLPDITIMDLKMPGLDGTAAVRTIRAGFPEARIIILTTFQGDEDIHKAMEAGAATYLLKDMLADELVDAVRAVHGGRRPIPEMVASRLAARSTQRRLTARETEVLRSIAAGARNKEVAHQLGISEETVQVHVKNLLSKLGVHDRTEAVSVGLRRGILHLD